MTIGKKEQRVVALVWLIGIVLVWELISFLLKNVLHDPMAAAKLPYPHIVVLTFIKSWKILLEAGAVTFSRAAIGFALGAVVGILLAVFMSLSKTMERIAFPYLIISQMIPILGLAPIIFNIVRDMDVSRIVIAASVDRALKALDKGGFGFALLDVNLGGETSAPIAESLAKAGVPFAFATGYGESVPLKDQFPGVPVLKKPYDAGHLRQALADLAPARTQ